MNRPINTPLNPDPLHPNPNPDPFPQPEPNPTPPEPFPPPIPPQPTRPPIPQLERKGVMTENYARQSRDCLPMDFFFQR